MYDRTIHEAVFIHDDSNIGFIITKYISYPQVLFFVYQGRLNTNGQIRAQFYVSHAWRCLAGFQVVDAHILSPHSYMSPLLH